MDKTSTKPQEAEGSSFFLDEHIPDDFDGLAERGLDHYASMRMRRLARGFQSIRGLSKVLGVLSLERESYDPADEQYRKILTPTAESDIIASITVMSDFLCDEVYSLGKHLTNVYAEGGGR